jgi:hypothetical protein
MDPDVQLHAQGERLLRHLLETGYFGRDDAGGFHVVEGAPEPDLSAICDRRGHVVPAIEDYISAIAHMDSSGSDTPMPSAG